MVVHPVDVVVLGGIEGVKQRLASKNIQSQISALSEALNYGDEGLDLIIDALKNESVKIKLIAYKLLNKINKKKIKELLETVGSRIFSIIVELRGEICSEDSQNIKGLFVKLCLLSSLSN